MWTSFWFTGHFGLFKMSIQHIVFFHFLSFSFSFSFSFLLHSICLEAPHESSHSQAAEASLLALIYVDDVVFAVLNLDAIQRLIDKL